jgi:hypothetical protein
MSQPFVIALREALQCSFILSIALSYGGAWERRRVFLAGVFAASIAGFSINYIPSLLNRLPGNETWTFLRYISESAVYYAAIAASLRRFSPSAFLSKSGFFVLGFFLFFFEARDLGFLARDTGLMKENMQAALASVLLGTAAGFAPLLFIKTLRSKIPIDRALNLPGLLALAGALKLSLGGVSELENGSLPTSLENGILTFLKGIVGHLQSGLLLTGHPFLNTPLSGLFRFLEGDRAAMALTVIFLVAPPVFILIGLFSKAEPFVGDISTAAQRRLSIASFRSEQFFKAMPALSSFVMILILIHSVNISLNPLTEPVPMPVRESNDAPGLLKIPLTDASGDFTDGKLRKYIYFYGDKQILFLAILKPDGAAGVALDECEICRPAEWNKSAFGYAQRGEHLVCKYCMTPIPLPTINSPGGCNPIPLPYKIDEKNIFISLNDLIRVYKSANALEKRGMHL